MTKPKPRPPFVHMGSGVSTEKRSLHDNSFRLKIVLEPPCKNRKQNVSCSRSHRLILWVRPQAERGGCMQGNGLEKESCAQLPLVSSSGPTLIELSHATIEMPLRLRCKTLREAGWLSVIRSTIYSIVIASRMLVRHFDVHVSSEEAKSSKQASSKPSNQ